MDSHTNVLIGIQARSTSDRFPRKVFEMIGDRSVLGHVLMATHSAERYINRHTLKSGIFVSRALLIPEGDEIKKSFSRYVPIIEGDEDDVLGRYMMAVEKFHPDYIVRITGDCPFVPSWLISKLIRITVINKYDYMCNCWGDLRTTPDGWDCEVVSSRLITWLNGVAEGEDREHVTTKFRKSIEEGTAPEWAVKNWGIQIGHKEEIAPKLSVDTVADLEGIRAHNEQIDRKLMRVEALGGNPHRF